MHVRYTRRINVRQRWWAFLLPIRCRICPFQGCVPNVFAKRPAHRRLGVVGQECPPGDGPIQMSVSLGENGSYGVALQGLVDRVRHGGAGTVEGAGEGSGFPAEATQSANVLFQTVTSLLEPLLKAPIVELPGLLQLLGQFLVPPRIFPHGGVIARLRARSLRPPRASSWSRQAHRRYSHCRFFDRHSSPNSSRYFSRSRSGVMNSSAASSFCSSLSLIMRPLPSRQKGSRGR